MIRWDRIKVYAALTAIFLIVGGLASLIFQTDDACRHYSIHATECY